MTIRKNTLSLLLFLTISISLYPQSESAIYGINRTTDPFNYFLGKIDINDGQISNCSNLLPSEFGGFGTNHFPAIDPVGKRYFTISSSKLYSIDLGTGEVLNSYDIGADDLWMMQYNFSDSTIYGINIERDPFEYYLGKIDLTTGTISNCQVKLPSEFGVFGTNYSPAIDPVGQRYFMISDKLWSIDLKTGEVLNSYDISGDDLWYMQYNFLDSTSYGINIKRDPFEFYLGKIDLKTGIISDCPVKLPSEFGGFNSIHSPTIDPIGNRYFMISSSKLWSIDLKTGAVLNSYEIGNDDLWFMQYNYKESINGINQTTEPDAFNIYPNPAKDYIYVESKIPNNKINITITDLPGHVLIDTWLSNDAEKIDISNLSQGVYIIQITAKQRKGIQKIIKIR